eukprot:m.412255 g.412255  ORF g.412255 m.412255 type:complete len:446 (+) comp28815_c0_seq1:406-1743(+)
MGSRPFVRRRDDSGEFSVELRCELGRPCRTVIHRFILLSWGEQRRASLGLNFLLLDLFLLLLLLIFVLGRLWVDPLGPTLRENVLHMVGPPCHCRVQKSRFADTLVFLINSVGRSATILILFLLLVKSEHPERGEVGLCRDSANHGAQKMRLGWRLLRHEERWVARHHCVQRPSEELGDVTRSDNPSRGRVRQCNPLFARSVAHEIRILVDTRAVVFDWQWVWFGVTRLGLLVPLHFVLLILTRQFVNFVLFRLRFFALFVHALRDEVVLLETKYLAPKVNVRDGEVRRKLFEREHHAERFFLANSNTSVLEELARADDVCHCGSLVVVVQFFIILWLFEERGSNRSCSHRLRPGRSVRHGRARRHLLRLYLERDAFDYVCSVCWTLIENVRNDIREMVIEICPRPRRCRLEKGLGVGKSIIPHGYAALGTLATSTLVTKGGLAD